MSTTLVLIQVLGGIGVAALGAVPLVLRGARRRRLAGRDDPRRPRLGSPAQVWLARGERVHRELNGLLAEHVAWQGVSSDAEQVVAELRVTSSQVAELDHALAQIQDPQLPAADRLREAKDALLARMEAAVGGLERARAEVLELIATAAALPPDPDPTKELNSRLAGLRAGLNEVRELADPEAGSGMDRGGQGHP